MRAVIIEDETLAIENLKYYLKDYPIDIIGSAFRLDDAVKLIQKEKPEVVFLDINLSGENGFDLLDRIDVNHKLVFVTAYNEYAVRAFEVNALDYILKPLSKERIENTVKRIFENRNERNPGMYEMDDVLFLTASDKAAFIRIRDIVYIEADSCYSNIYLKDQSFKVTSKTLKKWENMLPASHFVRVHRSYLLNVDYIEEIRKQKNGTFKVIISSSRNSIYISRRCASALRDKLQL